MAKSKIEIPKEKLELYDVLLAEFPEIERKGKTTPYTSLNGYMFSFLTKEGMLGLRLPKEEREKFLVKYNTELMVQYEKVMREFVVVPDTVFSEIPIISNYFNMSIEYTKSLKPK